MDDLESTIIILYTRIRMEEDAILFFCRTSYVVPEQEASDEKRDTVRS